MRKAQIVVTTRHLEDTAFGLLQMHLLFQKHWFAMKGASAFWAGIYGFSFSAGQAHSLLGWIAVTAWVWLEIRA